MGYDLLRQHRNEEKRLIRLERGERNRSAVISLEVCRKPQHVKGGYDKSAKFPALRPLNKPALSKRRTARLTAPTLIHNAPGR